MPQTETQEGPELTSVSIETEPDQDPQLDYLGEFVDDPDPNDRSFDRVAQGTWGRNERRYFVAADVHDTPSKAREAWERAEGYGSTWIMLGVRAVATVRVAGVEQTVRSGGLWGVNSDADDEYLNEIAREELSELRDVLDGLGVDVSDGLEAEWADDAPNRGSVTIE